MGFIIVILSPSYQNVILFSIERGAPLFSPKHHRAWSDPLSLVRVEIVARNLDRIVCSSTTLQNMFVSHHFSHTELEIWPGMVLDWKADSAEVCQLVHAVGINKQELPTWKGTGRRIEELIYQLSFVVIQKVTGDHGVFHVGRDGIILLVVNQFTINLRFTLISTTILFLWQVHYF